MGVGRQQGETTVQLCQRTSEEQVERRVHYATLPS
jgi:hypothetical protein